MYRCEECGYTTQTANQGNACPVCGKRMEEIQTAETVTENFGTEPVVEEIPVENQQKKKNKGGFKGIISTIIVIVVARLVGGFLGGEMANNFMGGSPEKKIDKFIEKVEKYEPGTFEDGVYESEYWKIKIEAEDGWEEMSYADLRSFNQGFEEGFVGSATEAFMEGDAKDEELIEKYKESLYCKTEAGFLYQPNGGLEGLVYPSVCAGYGVDEESKEEFIDGLFAGYTETMSNSKEGTSTLGGKKYQYVDGVMVQNGIEMNTRIYVRTEGVMISMIPIMYVGEDYDGFVESFESMVSAY